MARPTPRILPTEEGYDPPAAALTPCAGCGRLVLTRVYVHGTKEAPPHWRALAEAICPITGQRHVCRKED